MKHTTAIDDNTWTDESVPSGAFLIEHTVTNVPSGYTVVGVIGWNFGARHHVSVTGVSYYSGAIHIFGVNNAGATLVVNPSATLLCIKR